MIDFIKYTVDGATHSLVNNGDGTWSKSLNAPSISGRYNLRLEIGQDGVSTYIDSSDPRYSFYLTVIEDIERKVDLTSYVPNFIHELIEFNVIYDVEGTELDALYSGMSRELLDVFIRTASNTRITRLESFLRFKGAGTLEQRRAYLLSLLQKGGKLNEPAIKEIANTITGSDCIVKFYAADEVANPEQGSGLLLVQVLSPDNSKNYRYDDIFRALDPLVPAHLKLVVVKYFATWGDVKSNFTDWNAVKSMSSWANVKDFIPPQ